MSENSSETRRRRPKKSVLVAAIGVATVTFVGCPDVSLGNLVAPEPCNSRNEPPGCYPPWEPKDAGPDGGPGDADAIDADASDGGATSDSSVADR